MSLGRVEASILPLTWKFKVSVPERVTATDELAPSPMVTSWKL
jgi:hypothetical protein